MGASIVFSLGKLLRTGDRKTAYSRIFRRFFLLFALALLYSGGFSNEWPNIRLLGVLNRIALCYLVTALLFCHLGWRGLVAVFTTLLVGYWAMMSFIPVPGLGAGSMAKGANLANYLDQLYLPGKKWEGTWDPEGLLSTLPAIGTCLAGVFAGLLLQNSSLAERKKVLHLGAAGVASIVLGLLWSLHFPIIKKIWTSSYVLVAGGCSALLLALFHQITEVAGWRRWATPFVWIGANAITLYLANNIIGFKRLAQRFAGGDIKQFLERAIAPGAGELVLSIVGLLLAIGLAGFLYRQKIFLRV